MRKLVVAEFITLDGFIARKNGEMDFFSLIQNDQTAMENSQKNWDLILMGKNTYEVMSSFWPKVKNEDNKIAMFMNRTPKIVLSSSLKKAPWGDFEPLEIISNDEVQKVKNLKKQEGKDIVIMGSAMTSKFLLENDLVDEYYLWVYPIVLGEGKSLFEGISKDYSLELKEEKNLGKGVIELGYRVK